MKVGKKKVLAGILSAAMLTGLLQGTVLASDPVITEGLDFTRNVTETSGDGWVWESSTNTLTLNGINIDVTAQASSDTYGIKLPAGSTVVLAEGTQNTVAAADSSRSTYGIFCEGNLEIKGAGSLTVSAGQSTWRQGESIGIMAEDGDIAINGGSVNANGGNVTGNGARTYGILAEGGTRSITISGADTVIEAHGGDASGGPVTSSSGIRVSRGDISINAGTVKAYGHRATRSLGIGCPEDSGTISITNNADVTAVAGEVEDCGESYSYGMAVTGDITIRDSKVTSEGGRVPLTQEINDTTLATSYGIYMQADEWNDDTNRPESVLEVTNSQVTASGGDSDYWSFGIWAQGYINITDCENFISTAGEGSYYSCGIEAFNTITVNGDSDITAQGSESNGNSYGIWTLDMDVNDGPVEASGYTRGAVWTGIDMADYKNHIVYVEEDDVTGAGRQYAEDEQITVEDNLAKYQYVLITAGTLNLNITPADMIIYMGGSDGYDGTAGENMAQTGSTSLPKPLFYAELEGEIEGIDLSSIDKETDIAVTGDGGRRWEFELAGQDAQGNDLYYLNSTGYAEQEPVRVQFTDSEGNICTSDSFTPEYGILNASYDISIYQGGAAGIKVEGVPNCSVDTEDTGQLYVSYVVDNKEENPVALVKDVLETPVPGGSGAVTAPADTKYTFNNTTVPVDSAGVGLLFDSIYGEDGIREAVQARTDTMLGGADASRQYEARYLDLVDADNGNAWVQADKPVTVYWGYPKGTDENTEFTLVHFNGLHRGTDRITADMAANWDDVEIIDIENTENGIAFTIGSGGFSPFVLTWDSKEGTVEPGQPDGAGQDHAAGGSTVSGPQTGDNTNLFFWMMVLAASFAGAAGTAVYRRKIK